MMDDLAGNCGANLMCVCVCYQDFCWGICQRSISHTSTWALSLKVRRCCCQKRKAQVDFCQWHLSFLLRFGDAASGSRSCGESEGC